MYDDEAEKIDAIARKLENRYLSEEPQGTPYIDPWDEPLAPVNIASLYAGRMVRHFFRRLADDETLPIEQELLFIEQHPHAAPFVVVPPGVGHDRRFPARKTGLRAVERYTPKEAA